MHRQRNSQVTDLDRVGRVVGQVNCPVEHAVLGPESNGHAWSDAAIVLCLIYTCGVLGCSSLCRVELLPWTLRTPPRDLNMTKFVTCCDVVRWKGVCCEAETRQRTSVELKQKWRSRIDRLCRVFRLGAVRSQDNRRERGAGRKRGSPQQELTSIRSHRPPLLQCSIQLGIQL